MPSPFDKLQALQSLSTPQMGAAPTPPQQPSLSTPLPMQQAALKLRAQDDSDIAQNAPQTIMPQQTQLPSMPRPQQPAKFHRLKTQISTKKPEKPVTKKPRQFSTPTT